MIFPCHFCILKRFGGILSFFGHGYVFFRSSIYGTFLFHQLHQLLSFSSRIFFFFFFVTCAAHPFLFLFFFFCIIFLFHFTSTFILSITQLLLGYGFGFLGFVVSP